MNIGDRIKANRKRIGLTQEKLAEMVGTSRQAVTKWEVNQAIPCMENLITLSKIFDVALLELTGEYVKSISNETATEKKIEATLFRGIEGVGGHLHFESGEMVFKSHPFNIQKGNTHIPYAEIADIKEHNTLGIAKNGVLVTMKSGIKYKFVVWNREFIISFIKTQNK